METYHHGALGFSGHQPIPFSFILCISLLPDSKYTTHLSFDYCNHYCLVHQHQTFPIQKQAIGAWNLHEFKVQTRSDPRIQTSPHLKAEDNCYWSIFVVAFVIHWNFHPWAPRDDHPHDVSQLFRRLSTSWPAWDEHPAVRPTRPTSCLHVFPPPEHTRIILGNHLITMWKLMGFSHGNHH